MFTKNLILAGILAAGLVSADVSLSTQHTDAIETLPESVGISTTRSLRAMTKPTAPGDTAWTPPTYQTEPSSTAWTPSTDQTEPFSTSTPTYWMKPHANTAGSPSYASQCDNIGSNGGTQAGQGSSLLDLLVSIGSESIRSCCHACAKATICVAFTFDPLAATNVCALARLRNGRAVGQSELNNLLRLVGVVSL